MKALDIKISVKIIDSNSEKNEKKRLTIKDMTRMKLPELEKNVKELKMSIDKGEIDEYTINTFTTLCGRAIEELNKTFDQADDEKQKAYVNMMKDVLKLEKVDELNEKDLKEKQNDPKKELIKKESFDNINVINENNNSEDNKKEEINDNNENKINNGS